MRLLFLLIGSVVTLLASISHADTRPTAIHLESYDQYEPHNYIKLGNSLSFNFGTDDFSILTWVRPTELQQNMQAAHFSLLSKNWGAGGYSGYRLAFHLNRLYLFVSDGEQNASVHTGDIFQTNRWYHIAAIRRGQDLEIWVDGVRVVTNSNALDPSFDISSNIGLILGMSRISSTLKSGFVGDLDDFAIWSRALTEEQIESVMESGPDVNETDIEVYYDFQDVDFQIGSTIIDRTGKHDGTIEGTGTVQRSDGIVSTSTGVAIDDLSYFRDEANRSEFNFGESSFSVAAWYRIDSDSLPDHQVKDLTILSKNTASSNVPGFRLNLDLTTTGEEKLVFRVSDGGNGTHKSIGDDTDVYELDRWYFVVGVRDGHDLRLYVDGELRNEAVDRLPPGYNINTNLNQSFAIGAVYQQSGAIRGFEGDLDEISIWNRALSGKEVIALQHFPPAEARIDGLLAYYPLNHGNGDASPSGNAFDLTYLSMAGGSPQVAPGVHYTGHEIMQDITSRVPAVQPISLDEYLGDDTKILDTGSSITHEVINSSTILDERIYNTALSEPPADVGDLTAFVAEGINTFRFDYFSNEFRQVGVKDDGMQYLLDYAIKHGFNSVSSGKNQNWTENEVSNFDAWKGIHIENWLEDHGYSLNASNLCFPTLPVGVIDVETLQGEISDGMDAMGASYTNEVVSSITNIDVDAAERGHLGLGMEHPNQAFKREYVQCDFDFGPSHLVNMQGFENIHIAALKEAKNLGWKTGIYGWAPFTRSWGEFLQDAIKYQNAVCEADLLWEHYGKAVALEADVIYPSVYNLFPFNRNIPYVLANIDANARLVNSLSESDRKPIKPFYWNWYHGGGEGDFRWWRNRPVSDNILRAETLMNFFSDTDGLVLWGIYSFQGWYDSGDVFLDKSDFNLDEARFYTIKDDWVINHSGFQQGNLQLPEFSQLKRGDVIYVLRDDGSDLGIQILVEKHEEGMNAAAGGTGAHPSNTIPQVDAVWGGKNGHEILAADSGGPYANNVYTVSREDLQNHAQLPCDNLPSLFQGLALAKLFEYPLAHGESIIDKPSHESFNLNGASDPVGRRVKFGPYHLVVGFGVGPAEQNEYVLSDLFGGPLDVHFTTDFEARIYVLVE